MRAIPVLGLLLMAGVVEPTSCERSSAPPPPQVSASTATSALQAAPIEPGCHTVFFNINLTQETQLDRAPRTPYAALVLCAEQGDTIRWHTDSKDLRARIRTNAPLRSYMASLVFHIDGYTPAFIEEEGTGSPLPID
jgi:hypothetical protein